MRAAPLAALGILVLLMGPALASPLPETERELSALARDSLGDADRTLASALREARQLVRGLAREAGPENGELEVRATLVQPGVRGRDEMLALMWAGSGETPWRGAYWIESSERATTPSLVELTQEGALLYLDGGAQARGRSIDATYHFLGVDGRHHQERLGRIPLLRETPNLGRVDLGAAVATPGSATHEPTFLLTPWNLHGDAVTMGLTLRAGDAELASYASPDCGNLDAQETSPGCRLLYAFRLHQDLTSVELWRLEGGERVVDKTLTRAGLLAGYRFER